MEIQQLRHLIAAIEHGSLLKASEACNISQSGLSRSIRALEERIGYQLFVRMAKGVEPTVYGAALLSRARYVVAEVDRAMAELRALAKADAGEVRVGITQNYGHYFIPDLISDLTSMHAGMSVTVRSGGFLVLTEMLNRGEIDFIFGLFGDVELPESLKMEPLREHYARVVARGDHPLALMGREVTAEELSQAQWANLASAGFQDNFHNYFLSRGLPAPRQVVLSDSIMLIRKAVLKQHFLSTLPPDVVLEEVKSGTLVILDCDAPAEQTHVAIVYRTGYVLPAQCQLMMEAIRARLRYGEAPPQSGSASVRR